MYNLTYMNVKMLTRNIEVVDDFVSDEDVNALVKFCRSFKNWSNHYKRVPMTFGVDVGNPYEIDVMASLSSQDTRYYHPLISKYQSLVESYAGDFYGRSFVTYHNMHLRKYSTGDDFAPHYDSEAMVLGKPDRLPQYLPSDLVPVGLIEIAINIYLNDDYSGGELFFPELDLEIKPKPGQLVMFPGGHEFKHGVKEVLSGDRYTMASFLTTPKLLMLHAAAYNGAKQ